MSTKQEQKQVNVLALYSDLSRHGSNGDFERAVKICNKILHELPEEKEAFHCKIVSLIQLNKFTEALQFMNKNSKLAQGLEFEETYCYYRLNDPEKALKCINSVPKLTPKLKELKAQVLYRLEHYGECFDVYKDIIKNSADDYQDEREANLAAVVANLALEGQRDLPTLRETTYEMIYNSACALIAQGNYNEAEKKIRSAEKLCRETLEEDGMTEEDIQDEIAILRVQMAYCMQSQGREKEAQLIYNESIKQKPDDEALVAVASNNLVSLNRDQNIFDSKKRLRNATIEGLDAKLTSRQRKVIALNQCLLMALTGTSEQTVAASEKLLSQYPDSGMKLALIQATVLAKEGKISEAAKVLLEVAKKSPDKFVSMKLAIVQLMLGAGEKQEACKVLKDMGEFTFSPGIISALVTLYLAENDRESASNVLKEAVEWYKRNKGGRKNNLDMLWQQAAYFHLRSGEPKVAAGSLEELLKLNPSDTKTLAQLVIAYSQFDPQKAKELSKKLPAVGELSTKAEIDAIENTNWVMGTKVIKKPKVDPSPMISSDNIVKKKKKRKPGKLPKNYIEGIPADPERWLPRYERSGYRKKKDRRTKEVLKGSQGTTAGSADQYDMAARASQLKATASSPDTGAVPKQTTRKPPLKKKGKKGGKR